VYIAAARKLYQNVYLFEENILPLTKQKNMRECEIIVKESILNVIRESMPIEKILRAYMDETVEEEVVEETIEVPDNQSEKDKPDNKEAPAEVEKSVKEEITTPIIIKKEDTQATNESPVVEQVASTVVTEEESDNSASPTTSPISSPTTAAPKTPPPSPELNSTIKIDTTLATKAPSPPLSPSKITFNDKDNVVKYSSKDNPTKISKTTSEIISAPKTIERLERISTERNEQRKLEEAEEDEDEGDTIKILDSPIKLDALDIHDISTGLKLNTKPELTGVEVLA